MSQSRAAGSTGAGGVDAVDGVDVVDKAGSLFFVGSGRHWGGAGQAWVRTSGLVRVELRTLKTTEPGR